MRLARLVLSKSWYTYVTIRRLEDGTYNALPQKKEGEAWKAWTLILLAYYLRGLIAFDAREESHYSRNEGVLDGLESFPFPFLPFCASIGRCALLRIDGQIGFVFLSSSVSLFF